MKKDVSIFLFVTWPYFFNDLWLIYLQNDNLALLWTLDIVTYFLIPSISLLYLLKKKIINLNNIGVVYPIKIRNILIGILLCIVLLISIHFYIEPWFFNWFPEQLFYGYSFPETKILNTVTIIYASLTAGVLEEIIFRGLLIFLLFKYIKSVPAVVILSSFIFSLIHWSQGVGQVLTTFVWAIVPAIWYIKSKQIWGLIVCHFIYNFIIFSM